MRTGQRDFFEVAPYGVRKTRAIPYAAKALAAAAAFALLFHFTDFSALRGAVVRADRWLLLAGVSTSVFAQYLASQRWRLVLRSRGVDVGSLAAFRLNLIGTFFGNFLPGQGTGDLVKCSLLFQKHADKRAFLMASVLYDRLVGVLSMACVAVSAAFFLGTTSALREMWWIAVVAFGGILAGVAVLWWVSSPGFLRRIPPRWRPQALAAFADELFVLFRNVRLSLGCFGLSVIFQLLSVFTLWLMLAAVIPRPPFLPVLLSAPLSILIAAVPVSPGGLGIREGVFSFIMHRLGLDGTLVAAAALLGLLPLLLTSLAGGLLFLTRRQR